ncbi:MAG: hypothetical protein RSC36_05845 [Ruthenibacterium sp.]
MHNNRTVKTVLGFCGVAALLTAVMLCLNGVLALRDAAALRKSDAMPPQADLLSPDTEQIPLVSAFWQRAHFDTDATFFGSETAGDAVEISYETLLSPYRTLYEAGVLPESLWQTVQAQLTGAKAPENAALQIPGKLKFCKMYGGSCQVELFCDTVTAFSLFEQSGAPQTLDDHGIAQAYLQYLGLNGLVDWREIPLQSVEGWSGCALYSERAQLYVQVLTDARPLNGVYFTCGVSTLSPQAAAQRISETATAETME